MSFVTHADRPKLMKSMIKEAMAYPLHRISELVWEAEGSAAVASRQVVCVGRMLCVFAVAIGALGALGGCGNGGAAASAGATTAPAPPQPPAPTTGSATVSWIAPSTNTDGSALTDLAGYRIYYGTNTDALNQNVQIANPATVSYVIAHLATGTWYFSVAAYTNSGTESARSAVVSKTI